MICFFSFFMHYLSPDIDPSHTLLLTGWLADLAGRPAGWPGCWLADLTGRSTGWLLATSTAKKSMLPTSPTDNHINQRTKHNYWPGRPTWNISLLLYTIYALPFTGHRPPSQLAAAPSDFLLPSQTTTAIST
jgi:hypothetical protein